MNKPKLLNAEYHAEILATPEKLRVAVMAPLNAQGRVDLCGRWSESFLDAELETILIPVGTPNVEQILPHLDALLLPGGDSNVHPLHYMDSVPIIDDYYDLERDEFAFKLIRQAYDLNLPTLGICRGMQEMIVAFGGALEKLHTSIDHAKGYKNSMLANGTRCTDKMDWPVHSINIGENTMFHGMFQALEITVNSIHEEGLSKELFDRPEFQQLRELFEIQALAPDNVIEGMSAKGKTFFVGVQPHFEIGGPLHDALFDRYFSHIFAHNNARRTPAPQPLVEHV